MDSLIQSFVSSMQDKIPGELIVFIISLFPVLELRGGLIAASILGIEWWRAFIFCFVGNMLPIPFILLFIRKIFDLMRKWAPFEKIVDKLESKADKHREQTHFTHSAIYISCKIIHICKYSKPYNIKNINK